MSARKQSGAKINDELLIELVRKHRVMYDVSHPQYGDNKVKDLLWKDLGNALAADGPTCKLRWNNIRDQYRKRFKEFSAKGERPDHAKFYKYCEHLSFLTPFLNRENLNISNRVCDEAVIEAQPNNQTHIDPLDITRARTLSQSSKDSESSASTNPLEHLSKKTAESLVEYLLKKHEAETKPLHPVDAFLAALAAPLKALSPYQLHLAKGELFAVVHKYESQLFTDQEESVTVRGKHELIELELESKMED